MKNVSLCMIVKNEEEVLDRCLKSVYKFVNEIIIVDTGSTDKTIQIAKKYTDKIFCFKWCDDFSKARNYAFSLATSEYVMWLDADDIVPLATLKFLIKNKSKIDADTIMMKYDIAFYNNKATFSYYRERILKRCTLCYWQGSVHECIVPYGKLIYLDYSIEHRKTKQKQSNRNLNIYKNLTKQRKLNPREQYYYGRELYDNKKYKQSINVLKKFIADGKGWVENTIDACNVVANCYLKLNDKNNYTYYLLKTFNYDLPRANICCQIGDYFFANKLYIVAINWYLTAIDCEDVSKKGGFVENLYYNYYPYLQLCVCYYQTGNIKKSVYYNKKAKKICNSKIVQTNEKFFKQLKNKKC